jgi:hypothetical protein
VIEEHLSLDCVFLREVQPGCDVVTWRVRLENVVEVAGLPLYAHAVEELGEQLPTSPHERSLHTVLSFSRSLPD